MSEGPVDGRVRSGRPLLLGAGAVVLLVALPFLVRSTRTEVPEQGPPAASAAEPATPLPTSPHQGRLVYTTFETTGFFDRQQRLWGFDLAASTLDEGPLVPPVEEMFVVDPASGLLLLVALESGTGVGYLVDELSPVAEPREIARGDVLALTADRTAVLVGRVRPFADGCPGRGYDVGRVSLDTGVERPLGSGCGRLLALAASRDTVLVSEARGDRAVVRDLRSGGVVLHGFALVSISPTGDVLVADPEQQTVRALGVWPETPTGALHVWHGAGEPRPLVGDVRLFGERLVTWAPDGSAAVVSGIIGGDRAMYLVRDGVGSVLLDPNSFPLRSAFSGASFDDEGTAYAASVDHIVVTAPTGVEPVTLPPGAPSPLGPVVWLP